MGNMYSKTSDNVRENNGEADNSNIPASYTHQASTTEYLGSENEEPLSVVGSQRYAKRRVNELLNACDGKWGEQFLAVSVPDPSNINHLKATIISPESAPTANYMFSLDITLPKE